MDIDKQLLLLELLCSSSKIFNMCNSIIEPEYFSEPYDKIIRFIKQYFNSYKTIPSTDIIKVETHISLSIHKDVPDDIFKWACNEIEMFCRTQAMRLILLDAPKLLASNNDGLILQQWQKASQISINQDDGHDYFDNIKERIQVLTETQQIITTGIPYFDEAIVPCRQELHLIMGNSGGGKSLTLGNIAFYAMIEGYHVQIISLEMRNEKIAQRIDSIATGFNPKEYALNADEILFKIKELQQIVTGSLHISRIKPYSDCNTVRAEVEKYKLKYGRNPDVIIVDYMGRLKPIDKSITAEHIKDERVSDELREIGVDYNALIWSGSQMNRGAVDADIEDIGQHKVAGGIAKFNPVESATAVIFNDLLKFYGEIVFKIVKSRNSEDAGKVIYCDWIHRSMRIAPREKNESKLPVNAKNKLTTEMKSVDNIVEQANKKPTSTFLDRFNDTVDY